MVLMVIFFSTEEIAMKIGVSTVRTRQIADKALRKLRHPKISKYFFDYGRDL